MFKSRNIHRKIKIRIYKTIIRTVVAYGCESWSITNKSADMLDRFERKILRKIFGPMREEGTWRARYSHELYQLYGEAKLSMYIKIQRLGRAMGRARTAHAIK